MYSFHSSPEEKNQLLYTLTRYGIETTVDRTKKKDRIREWIQCSAIAEENEDEESLLEDLEIENETTNADESGSMKQRHFPERRPSAPTTVTSERIITNNKNKTTRRSTEKNDIDDNNTRRRSKSVHKNRSSLKNFERKNPFTPQVAAEMQTILRFANFPNGDPSLAIPLELNVIRTDNLLPLRTEPVTQYTIQKSPQPPMRKHREQIINLSLTDNQQQTSRQQDLTKEQNPLANSLNHNPNPLTMSVASHLVMQSFNALQNVNNNLANDSTGATTLTTGSLTHTKDVYEHYGITQGNNLRRTSPKISRHGGSTSGSGSRSVSN